MPDTQWETYEVFHQTRRGKPHEHVGSVHAPDPGSRDVTQTDYQDPNFFSRMFDKSYRDPKAFEAPAKE
jgi:ring-1,2-phenylacetyl-CoA epoxidase subunit PaaB